MKKLTQVKNKIFNFLHLINVQLVKGAAQNQDIQQIDVLTVVEMEKLDLIKDFLLYNKHVRNVMEVEKKLRIHVTNVMVKWKQTYFQKISVTIPKGVDDGTRIRLAGKGEAGTRGGASGDLYLFINVKSHDLFKRSDENLFFEFPISIADAALGTTIEIPTIDGKKSKNQNT